MSRTRICDVFLWVSNEYVETFDHELGACSEGLEGRVGELTVKSALVPVGLGWAGDRRGADRSTSGVNLVAVRVMFD